MKRRAWISRAGAPAVAACVLCGWLAAQESGRSRAPGFYGSEQARPVAPWMKGTIIYQMWLRAYGPKDNFKHAEEHLEDAAKLGATMVQISPIHPHWFGPPPHGSPYSVDDYYAINPDYGTAEDFHRFIDHAHKLGLKLIMDVVYYHSSIRCGLLQQRPEFFMHDAQGKVVLGRWSQPRFDTANPATRKYLVENLIYWVKNFQVNGFRADVAGGLPMARQFWEEAHDALDRVKPGLFLLAEASSPELQLHGFDASYGFAYMITLQSILRGDAPASMLRRTWENDRARFPAGTLLLRALDNHDQRRAITEFGNRACLAGMAVCLMLDGVPFIYNGQEIGDPAPISVYQDFPIRWDTQRYARGNIPVLQKLIRIRKEHPALSEGQTRWIGNSGEDQIVSFLRKQGDEEVVVVANLANRPWSGTLDLMDEEYPLVNLVTGERVRVFPPHNVISVSLKAFDYLIAKKAAPGEAR